jgi:hypothetical protein
MSAVLAHKHLQNSDFKILSSSTPNMTLVFVKAFQFPKLFHNSGYAWRHNQCNIILYLEQLSGHFNAKSYFLLLIKFKIKTQAIYKISTNNIFYF